MSALMIADATLQWRTPWSTLGLSLIVLSAALAWCVVRLGWGSRLNQINGGMLLIRLTAAGLLLAILLGPTHVDEQPGMTKRPTLAYLYDGSGSMALGQEETRWEESINFVDVAQQSVDDTELTDCQSFRFGHRLLPLIATDAESTEQEGDGDVDPAAPATPSDSNAPVAAVAAARALEPDASDSRLADALRQMLPVLDPAQTSGVVLLSDGRVRATESVETLASHFADLKIPIHVVPVGHAKGTGDIAIVSLVTQPEVRKYTENEVQVFFRSFGYSGERTTVRLVERNQLGGEEVTLASIPVTLTGGAQSSTLTFRVDADPSDLAVIIDPVAGELTERNNRVETRVTIDRTKVRVLYIEGDSGQQSLLGQLFNLSGRSVDPEAQVRTLQQALQTDEDIECVVLVSPGGNAPPRAAGGTVSTSVLQFPQARSELFAFDCIVLSNVSPQALEDRDLARLAQWVDGRGGGLIVTGADSLRPEDWQNSPLAPVMPVDFNSLRFGIPKDVEINVTMPSHPVWRLNSEQQRNQSLLQTIPPLSSGVSELQPRNTAEVLATRLGEQAQPVFIAHRFGRGRVLVSSLDLSGRAIAKLGADWGAQPSQTIGKFWRNLVYWTTEGSAVGRRRLVAETDKRFYRPGDALEISAFAYDEAARKTQDYRIYGMFEPMSLDDMSLYSPILWPENVVRESGEVGPRIAWGEELRFPPMPNSEGFRLPLQLSESSSGGDSGLRIELTAYEGEENASSYGHGTQVDSTSLEIRVLSDPFEQQNPLPNHEFLARIASLSGGSVLRQPDSLARIIRERERQTSAPELTMTPAWSHWWLWLGLVGLITTEWVWRRLVGMA